MLRYKTETRPGLVALYDLRPGNGAGQFLQPRSPRGDHQPQTFITQKWLTSTELDTNTQNSLQTTAR